MKTVRFSKVLQTCGQPEVHLLLVEPEKDKALSHAIRLSRVMTLYQSGKGTDYARVGFEEGKARQYLIFPKSLSAFADQQIVGLKYDLLEPDDAEPEESLDGLEPRQPAVSAEQKAEPQAVHQVEASKPLVSVSNDSSQLPARETPTQTRPKKAKTPAQKDHVPAPHADKAVDLSPPKSTTLRPTESEQLAKIKDQLRKAMNLLEEGKQVAAFNVLKEIADLPLFKS
jgi:hypothetical protein